MSNQRRRRKTKKNKKKFSFKKIIAFLAGLFGLLVLALGGISVYWIATAPEITQEDLVGTLGSKIVDESGEVIYQLGTQDRDLITAEEIPPVLEHAVLAIEDQRFYDHIGIDPIRLAGAVVANIRDGYGSQGGSTITQQLVKLSVFSTDSSDQNLKRKVQEAWLALQLERELSKEEILTLYINKVYMSDNVYGIGTASNYYYGKPANQLELQEAALLAGIPQLPNSYNPYDNPELAKKRRDTVLYAMLDMGSISEETVEQAAAIPVDKNLVERSLKTGPNLVIDAYIKEVLAEIDRKTDINPYSSGSIIYTNIDMAAQGHLYDVLNTDQYIQYPNEEFQAGVSIVDTKTGKVLALGGGRNQEHALSYNRATELNRTIASTMKPLSVYGPAIEYLKQSTYDQLEDSPYAYPTGDRLENYDNRYVGKLSTREALVDSRNIPTTRLLEEVRLDRAGEFLANIGIDDLNGGDGLYWSNAIGGEVTPLQLAASYAAFGNEGRYTDPYTISKIVLRDGQEIDMTPETTRGMSDYTAYMVTDMLKDSAARIPYLDRIPGSLPHAGKTGTSNYSDDIKRQYNIPDNNFPDRWYAGYTTQFSMAIWTGYDYQHEQGHWMSYADPEAYISLEIYEEMLLFMSQNVTTTDWVKPDSVVEYSIVNGTDPAEIAPSGRTKGVVTELFVKGSEPTVRATEEDEKDDDDDISLEAVSGLTASYDSETDILEISWNPVEIDEDKDLDPITYELTIGDQTYTVSDTSYSLSSPPSGNITVSVQAISGEITGPSRSIKVEVTEEAPEEPEEIPDDSTSDQTPDSSDQESSDTTSTPQPPASNSLNPVETPPVTEPTSSEPPTPEIPDTTE